MTASTVMEYNPFAPDFYTSDPFAVYRSVTSSWFDIGSIRRWNGANAAPPPEPPVPAMPA